jgi:two-component system response regulator HydG
VVVDLDGLLDVDDLSEDIPLLHPDRVEAGWVSAGGFGSDGLIGKPLDDVEKFYIQKMLELTEGNREEAAHKLGIGARTLYRKIKAWGLT